MGEILASFPETLHEEAEAVPWRYDRIENSHEMNWASACKKAAKLAVRFRMPHR